MITIDKIADRNDVGHQDPLKKDPNMNISVKASYYYVQVVARWK